MTQNHTSCTSWFLFVKLPSASSFYLYFIFQISNVNRMGFGVVLVFNFLAPSMPATCYSCRSALSILGSRFKSRRKAESKLSWSSESSKCFPNTQSAAGQTELVFQDPKHPETYGDPDCRACCYWIRMRQRSTTWKNLHESAWKNERIRMNWVVYIYNFSSAPFSILPALYWTQLLFFSRWFLNFGVVREWCGGHLEN